MKPIRSYRIWFTQRNGSTLLCKGLEQTGVAGIPLELFNVSQESTLSQMHQAEDYNSLRSKLWEKGTSANGIFGIKHSYFSWRHDHLIEELRTLQGLSDTATKEEVFADLFPNCKQIYMTRRNKVRVAVSWWKAIQDGKWHFDPGTKVKNDPSFYEDKYNVDALKHLFKEATLRECAIQEYFSEFGMTALNLVYEDWIHDFSGTIELILDYLEISKKGVIIPKMYFEPTSDELSEQWVQRFKDDLQEGMDQKVW